EFPQHKHIAASAARVESHGPFQRIDNGPGQMTQFLALSKKSEACRQLEIGDQLQRGILVHAAQEPFEGGPLKMPAPGVEIAIELVLETFRVGHRNPNRAAISGHPFDLAQRRDRVRKMLESEIDYSEIE